MDKKHSTLANVERDLVEVVEEYNAVVRKVKDDDRAYFEAVFRELGESISSYGESPTDALGKLYDEGRDFVEFLREQGKEIPEPIPHHDWAEFSGKVTIRMPRSLHYNLFCLADEEGISLNALLVYGLSCYAQHALSKSSVQHNHLYYQHFDVNIHSGNTGQGGNSYKQSFSDVSGSPSTWKSGGLQLAK